MTRKRQSTKIVPIILFIVIVALTGYGLVATGHFSNPFGFLMQTQGGGRPANFNNRSKGNASSTAANLNPPGDRGGPSEASSSISIDWSQIGSVFFNLWYLCATTAVVIVVQKIG